MRELGLVGIVFLVLAFSLPASASCSHELYGNAELNQSTLTIPTTIIVKKVQKALGVPTVAPEIEVTLEFNAAMEFRLVCGCRPCCRAPQKQVASLTVSASIRAFGGTVMFAGARSEARDGEPDPSPLKECEVEVMIAHNEGERVLAVGLGFPLRVSRLGESRSRCVSRQFRNADAPMTRGALATPPQGLLRYPLRFWI